MDGQIDDPQQRKPDIRKAAEMIDWQPKVRDTTVFEVVERGWE